MTEEIKLDDKLETTNWESYVRSEVDGILSAILPNSERGAVGIQYKNLVTGETEGGEEIYSDSKAVGVDIILSFDFGEEIDKPM